MELLTLIIFLVMICNVGFWLIHHRCIYVFVYEFIDNEVPKTYINDKYIKRLKELVNRYVKILLFLLGIYVLSSFICATIIDVYKLKLTPMMLFIICNVILVYFVNISYKKYKMECLFVYKHYVTESKVRRLRRKRK